MNTPPRRKVSRMTEDELISELEKACENGNCRKIGDKYQPVSKHAQNVAARLRTDLVMPGADPVTTKRIDGVALRRNFLGRAAASVGAVIGGPNGFPKQKPRYQPSRRTHPPGDLVFTS